MALQLSRKLIYSTNARRLAISLQQHRNKATTPINLGVLFVPQQVGLKFARIIMKSEIDSLKT